jgi:hypothetical protein
MRVENNHNSSDATQLGAATNVGAEPAPGLQTISWFLTDSTQTAFSSVALGTTPPVLSSWQQTSVLQVGRVTLRISSSPTSPGR